MKGNTLLIIAIILVILGAINWGWIGLTNNNIITSFNDVTFRSTWLERVVYIIVGIAGLYLIYEVAVRKSIQY